MDKNAEDPRPWIEKVKATYPTLIDTQYVVADLYGMVNIPTIVWIDEQGTIVRPNDVFYVTDKFKEVTGIDAETSLNKVRAWVKGETSGFDAAKTHSFQSLPTDEMQAARAEFSLGKWFYEQGRHEAAKAQFVKAGELSPQDWTIVRGSMTMQDVDPFGPIFREKIGAVMKEGNRFYYPLPE